MTLSNHGVHRAAALFVVTLAASPHAFSAQAGPAAQSAEIVRHYDLRPSLTAGVPPPAGVTMDLHVSTSAIDGLEPGGYDVDLGPETDLEAEDCLDAIRFALRSAEGAEVADLAHDERRLRLTGNAAAHRAAAAALGQLEALNLNSVDVEVVVIPRTPALLASAGWISAEAASTLLSEAPNQRRSLFPVRIGRRTTLNQTQTKSFLHDYDVEIAQGAVVADPTVSILRTGTHLGVRVDHAADGTGFVVRTWGRSGAEAAPMRSITLPVLGDTVLELPSVHSSIWASSARLADGEAMVIDAGAEELMLLLIREDTASGSMPRVSLGAHALQPMRPEILSLPRAAPSGGYGHHRQSMSSYGPEALMERLDKHELLEQLNLTRVPTIGTHLLCPQGSKAAQEATAAIQALTKAQPVAEYAIDVRFQVLNASGAKALRGTTDWSAFANDPSTRRFSSTTIGHDATLLVSGIETAYLQDHDMQIAAGAVGPDPIVKTTFQGASIWCSPMRTASGDIRAWFDVQVQEDLKRPRTITAVSYHPAPDTGNKNSPRFEGEMRLDLPIELPVTESAGGISLARLNDGAWGHVLTQAIGRDGAELLVIAKITIR
ncbi:MAG: hypothetical protein ACI80K_004776 [Paracoccaceae bacterium]|jgi:hypothetical protein